ncbi:restriction endonuclease subunit S [Mitsuaria sp. CC2]|uniref:restriction endonuclease subunit S n=1 Tax=Mitsuaria sp. CC2 TaxID=3029186 RepID=UPI003B8BA095
MQSEWPLAPIGEVAQVFDGPHATPKKTSAGPVFLGISSLNNGRLDLSVVEHLSEDDFTKWTRRVVPQAGDVVFSYETRLGQVAIIPPGLRCCLGRRMALVRPDRSRLLPRYFLYYFLSDEFQALLKARTIHGSTVERLPLTDFPSYPVRLPSIETQRQICDVLAAIDDRIDLLRQTNATLESIAQALFKSWFIDFDPVRAKAEGREPEGMDAATAALFPAEFEESALGLIPRGWRAAALADAVELNPSRSLPKGVEARYLEMANAPTSGHRPLERVERRAFGSGCKFRNGDALLAKITPCLENGKSAYVDFLDDLETGWGSTEFIVLRAKPVLPQYGAYLLARHEPFRQFAIQAMTGTSGRQRVELSRLTQFPLALPPDSTIAGAAEATLLALQSRIAANDEQAKGLAELRDTLLPRLISGRLRLPEAQAQVEEAIA